MKKILLLIMTITTFSTQACIVLLADGNGKKDHPAIKHYLESSDKTRSIVIENPTDMNCKFSIQKRELIQSRDGSYSFLPSQPGIKIERSLTPFMSLLDESGRQVFDIEMQLAAKSKATYSLQIDIPEQLNNGSYHAGFEIEFPQASTSMVLGEVYYTTKNSQVSPMLKFIKYNSENKKLLSATSNKGNAYTFFKMKLIYTDPLTGFESKGVTIDKEFYPFELNIRNHLLPNRKTIITESSLSGHLKLLRKQFSEKFPNEVFPEHLNLTIIPLYGIDHDEWVNHKSIPLSLKSIMIKTNK
ncbi:hypothetical protein [Halobacteriovorax sp.]|uniref:hypothetical protein n=1 Tax=Halobacteriovorax sp. TaxID=2020862 RepID=UPI003AF2E0F7